MELKNSSKIVCERLFVAFWGVFLYFRAPVLLTQRVCVGHRDGHQYCARFELCGGDGARARPVPGRDQPALGEAPQVDSEGEGSRMQFRCADRQTGHPPPPLPLLHRQLHVGSRSIHCRQRLTLTLNLEHTVHFSRVVVGNLHPTHQRSKAPISPWPVLHFWFGHFFPHGPFSP